MKKIVNVMLALSILSALFTGCEKEKNDKKKKISSKTTTESVLTEESSNEEIISESVTSSETTEMTVAPTEAVAVDQDVSVGMYTFTVNSMWTASQWENGVFIAHPKEDEQGATLQIACKETTSNVSYKTLRRNAKNGKMDDFVSEPYDSCENIQFEEYDNGTSQGIKFTADYKKGNEEGTCCVLVFPDEANHSWVEVRMDQPKGARIPYINELDTIGGTASLEKKEETEETQTNTESQKDAEKKGTQAPAETSVTPNNTPAPKNTPAPNEPSKTRIEQAADLVKQWISEGCYRRNLLISRLEEKGYTHEEAVYAIENCGEDWKEIAVLNMKDKISDPNENFGFPTPLQVRSYMKEDGFTEDEITYACSQCNNDFKTKACDFVQWWLTDSSRHISRANVISVMVENWGFTKEQAEYGIEHSGANWKEVAVSCAKLKISDPNENFGFPTPAQVRCYLKEDGFSEDEIAYACSHCNEEFKAKACDFAKWWLIDETRQTSRTSVISVMVENWGFTTEQAEYGADHCGAKWKIYAGNQVYRWLNEEVGHLLTWTPQKAMYQLKEIGYTQEEAEYGVKNCGVDWQPWADEEAHRYIQRPRIPDGPCEENWNRMHDLCITAGFTEKQAKAAADKWNI